jgi:nitroreductase
VIRYPDLLRTLFAIPEDKKVVMGFAMGYPDESDPINRFERQRIAVEDFVTWME